MKSPYLQKYASDCHKVYMLMFHHSIKFT